MRTPLLLLAAALSLAACTGTITGPRPEARPSEQLPPEELPPGPLVYPPAGIRRLSQAELQTAASQLLGLDAAPLATAMGKDIRQSGFTRNADQRVGSVQADELWHAAQALAHDGVVQRLNTLAPCAAGEDGEACAQRFIHAFAPRAFRRPVQALEEAALLSVFRAGQSGATYAEGIELVITAVLQSASFLYVTELGGAVSEQLTTLTGEEIATSLALLFTGAPADEALLASGRAGELMSAEGREAAARALLSTPAARAQLERLLLEWQGTDSLDTTLRDIVLFPEWTAVREDMLAESRAIIDAVLFEGDGTLKSLLSTPKTNLTPGLASFYGLTGSGPMEQPAFRRGLLLAGAFPAANSHFAATAPVRRGAVVRKKLLCQELPLPTGVGVNIVVPPPDPALTTRERFSVHSRSPNCSGCHVMLDPIGFAMESFDAVGRYRTTENGKPIDTAGALVSAGDAEGAFTDAVEMSALLASSKTVASCFQHQLYRFASGRSGVAEEATFARFLQGRLSARDGTVLELLVDYAKSDSFVLRRQE